MESRFRWAIKMAIVITVFSFEVEMIYSKETPTWLCSSVFLIPKGHRYIFRTFTSALVNNRGSLGYLGTMVNLPGISQEYMDLVYQRHGQTNVHWVAAAIQPQELL